MKRFLLAAIAALVFSMPIAAGDPQRDVLSIAYSKDKSLVAAAYTGGQVVLWDFESGRLKKVYNASGPKSTLNLPLVHFGPGGRRLAFTQDGDAGLVSCDPDTGASTTMVPRRLLVKGITAFSWSQRGDTMLVAIGRDIFLINAQGHIEWQHRLETHAIITDVAWHPSEKFYTVATDDGEVSTWEAASGRVMSSSKLPLDGHSTALKAGWTSEDWLFASVRGTSLAVLDPETLKPNKTTPCNCLDFTWSPGGKEIFAWDPPNIAIFGESGQRTREIRTPFSGAGAIVWAGESRLLTSFADSTVVLRDARTGRIIRTFVP